MTVLAGEFTFGLTYPSSHTFWHVLEASGIGVIVLAVVVFAIWLLFFYKGPGPMG